MTDKDQVPLPPHGDFFDPRIESHPRRRWWVWLIPAAILAVLLYYPLAAWQASVIDDDLSYGVESQAGQSKAVAIAAGLLHREVDDHGWTPNDPPFLPSGLLDDMPAFQIGIAEGVARFVNALDQAQRQSAPSGDLQQAASLLRYPPDVWVIDPSAFWKSVVSSDTQYADAAKALDAYGKAMAQGQAMLDRRPAVLAAILIAMSDQLQDQAGHLASPVTKGGGWLMRRAAVRYYGAKGRAYADALILRELGQDYAEVLAERKLTDRWKLVQGALEQAAAPRPWVVLAGGPDSTFVPNHPAVLGFHLMWAREQIKPVIEALR